MWDPGMAHAMAEMICMEGLRQDMLSQEAVEARHSLLAGLLRKWALPRQCQTFCVRPSTQGHEAGQRPWHSTAKNGLQLCWRRNSSREQAGWVSLQAWEAFQVCVWRFFCTSLNIFKWPRFCCYKLNSCFSGSLSSCFQLNRFIPFVQFFISLPSALLIRVHVSNILIDLRLDHVRIHVSMYHMPKLRCWALSECADASSVPRHVVNLLWTSEDK